MIDEHGVWFSYLSKMVYILQGGIHYGLMMASLHKPFKVCRSTLCSQCDLYPHDNPGAFYSGPAMDGWRLTSSKAVRLEFDTAVRDSLEITAPAMNSHQFPPPSNSQRGVTVIDDRSHVSCLRKVGTCVPRGQEHRRLVQDVHGRDKHLYPGSRTPPAGGHPSFLGSQSVPAGARQALRIRLRIPLLLTNRASFRPDTQLLFMQSKTMAKLLTRVKNFSAVIGDKTLIRRINKYDNECNNGFSSSFFFVQRRNINQSWEQERRERTGRKKRSPSQPNHPRKGHRLFATL